MDVSGSKGQGKSARSCGRFTRVCLHSPAGELEARLSDHGNWELRLRGDEEKAWRLACRGDLDAGTATAERVVLPSDEAIRIGPLTIEPAPRRVLVDGEEVVLTHKEFALVLMLSGEPARVYAKSELLEAIWGDSDPSRTNSLVSHVTKARRKLKKAGAPGFLVSVHGVGFRMLERPDLIEAPPLPPSGVVGR